MKKAVSLIIIIFLVVFIRNLIISIRNNSQKGTIVKTLELELEDKKKENQFLKQKLSYVKSNEFVEKEARNKLGMVKEGEYVVIVPPLAPVKEEKKPEEIPNWKKWLKVFFSPK